MHQTFAFQQFDIRIQTWRRYYFDNRNSGYIEIRKKIFRVIFFPNANQHSHEVFDRNIRGFLYNYIYISRGINRKLMKIDRSEYTIIDVPAREVLKQIFVTKSTY